MKPEKQRIKIAEACGWKKWDGENTAYPLGYLYESETPDYLNDLNAMHEAEKVLTEGQRRTFFFHLFGTQRLDDSDLWKAVHATAAQRAEAFLRTLNLWE